MPSLKRMFSFPSTSFDGSLQKEPHNLKPFYLEIVAGNIVLKELTMLTRNIRISFKNTAVSEFFVPSFLLFSYFCLLLQDFF